MLFAIDIFCCQTKIIFLFMGDDINISPFFKIFPAYSHFYTHSLSSFAGLSN